MNPRLPNLEPRFVQFETRRLRLQLELRRVAAASPPATPRRPLWRRSRTA